MHMSVILGRVARYIINTYKISNYFINLTFNRLRQTEAPSVVVTNRGVPI